MISKSIFAWLAQGGWPSMKNSLRPGTIITGTRQSYRIRRLLPQEGTTAVILLAVDATDDHVVIKLWTNQRAANRERVLRDLSTIPGSELMPWIDDIRDSATGDLKGYVMPYKPINLLEWYRGKGWLTQLRSHPDSHDVRRLVATITDTLESIHNAGYVHCDIKPAHIRFDHTRAMPVLADGSSIQAIAHFDRQQYHCTPLYAPRDISALSDLRVLDWYGLAATLYHMYEGHAPRADGSPIFVATPPWLHDPLRQVLTGKIASAEVFRTALASAWLLKPHQGLRTQNNQLTPWRRFLGQKPWDAVSPRWASWIQVIGLLVTLMLIVNHLHLGAISQSGIIKLGLPLIGLILGWWRPGALMLMLLCIETLVMLFVAPPYGVLLGVLGMGVMLSAGLGGNSLLLMLLAALPLLSRLDLLLIFPVLVWLLKPSRMQRLRIPVAALSVGLWLWLAHLLPSCQPLLSLCEQATLLPTNPTGSPLWLLSDETMVWPVLEYTPQILLGTISANIYAFYPLWPVLVWAIVEWVGAELIRSRIEIFAPYERLVIGFGLLALAYVMLGLGLQQAAHLSIVQALRETWTAFEPTVAPSLSLLLLIALLYDPDSSDKTGASLPLVLMPLAAIGLLLALPVLMEWLPQVAGLLGMAISPLKYRSITAVAPGLQQLRLGRDTATTIKDAGTRRRSLWRV